MTIVATTLFFGFPDALPPVAFGVGFAVMGVLVVARPRPAVLASSVIGGILLAGLAVLEWLQNPINVKSEAAQGAIGLWIAIASTVALRRAVRHRPP